MKVLIGACIRERAIILERFLAALTAIDKEGLECDYFFILNNLDSDAKVIFNRWNKENKATVEHKEFSTAYIRDQETHHWTTELVNNVIIMRNRIVEYARKNDYDYLFIPDSDEIHQSHALKHLISHKKDVITTVYWSKWHPDEQPLPNVWFFDNYGFYPDSLDKLRHEELIQVGGIGGCKLISKNVLKAGIDYTRIPNLPENWGEDRFFCVRAATAGFELWVDTTIPPKHLYRLSDLEDKRVDNSNQKLKIYLAVPHTGNINPNLVGFIVRTLGDAITNQKFDLTIDLHYGMPVDSCRNDIVKQFLESSADFLLMIDSDIVPPDGTLDVLLSRSKNIICAICFSMMPLDDEHQNAEKDLSAPYPVIMKRAKDEKGWNVNRDIKFPIMEVDATGASCLLIHRSVLESIGTNWFRLGYNERGIVDVVGEDFDFCMKAKAKGFQIFVDTTLQCSHYKTCDIKAINKLLADMAKNQNR